MSTWKTGCLAGRQKTGDRTVLRTIDRPCNNKHNLNGGCGTGVVCGGNVARTQCAAQHTSGAENPAVACFAMCYRRVLAARARINTL